MSRTTQTEGSSLVLGEENIYCRAFGHMWRPTIASVGKKDAIQECVCERCDTRKEVTIDFFGHTVKARYDYSDHYKQALGPGSGKRADIKRGLYGFH